GTGSAHGQEVSPFGLGWVAAALAVAGAALRLGHFVARRPLWLDECMLALNVATRSAVGLVRPLDYDQVAPLLFLWIERLAVRLGGVNELALRAWPALAGIALVVLMWPVARRLAGPGPALAAVAMAAFSPSPSIPRPATPTAVPWSPARPPGRRPSSSSIFSITVRAPPTPTSTKATGWPSSPPVPAWAAGRGSSCAGRFSPRSSATGGCHP